MNGLIEVTEQDLANSEDEVLLGGIWYPWYSHETKKQLKAAEIYARKVLNIKNTTLIILNFRETTFGDNFEISSIKTNLDVTSLIEWFMYIL